MNVGRMGTQPVTTSMDPPRNDFIGITLVPIKVKNILEEEIKRSSHKLRMFAKRKFAGSMSENSELIERSISTNDGRCQKVILAAPQESSSVLLAFFGWKQRQKCSCVRLAGNEMVAVRNNPPLEVILYS